MAHPTLSRGTPRLRRKQNRIAAAGADKARINVGANMADNTRLIATRGARGIALRPVGGQTPSRTRGIALDSGDGEGAAGTDAGGITLVHMTNAAPNPSPAHGRVDRRARRSPRSRPPWTDAAALDVLEDAPVRRRLKPNSFETHEIKRAASPHRPEARAARIPPRRRHGVDMIRAQGLGAPAVLTGYRRQVLLLAPRARHLPAAPKWT